MSLRNTVRALPALARVGFADAVAYRAEFVVWVLATTMPLVMLALWSAVARDGAVSTPEGARYDQPQLVAYFLSTFVVRQLTGSWAGWEMSMDIRQGTLSMRLLRPVQPLAAYVVDNVAAMPLRMLVALPVAVLMLIVVGGAGLSHDPVIWTLWATSLLGGWAITVLVSLGIGCLAFFLESSNKVMDVYLALFFMLSGYLAPMALLPPWVRAALDWLPFRYQMALPVDLMTGVYDGRHADALSLCARQWLFVVVAWLAVLVLWRRGIARFEAYGG